MVISSVSATHANGGNALGQGGPYVLADMARCWSRPHGAANALRAAQRATHSGPTQPMDTTPALDDFWLSRQAPGIGSQGVGYVLLLPLAPLTTRGIRWVDLRYLTHPEENTDMLSAESIQHTVL